MDTHTIRNQQAYNEHAREWHAAMSANVGHLYVEKPAMGRELPDTLFGKEVLCIGVGSGEELALLVKRGPRRIIATGISSELLDIAKKEYGDVEYRVMDMMDLSFPNLSFDLVYSSLTFHYAQDWDMLLARVRRVLKAGGTLLFSTHHPGYWSKHPTGETVTNSRGVILTEHTAILPGGTRITYYNHPNTASIEEAVSHAGFRIERAFAPHVIPALALPPEEHKKYENIAATNAATPLFYIVRAVAV